MSKTKKHVETSPETIQEKVELTQEKDESLLNRNDETPVETDEDGEEDMENVSAIDLNTLIHMRVYDGLSFRQIAERQNLSLSMVARLLKGVVPQETDIKTEADLDGEALRPVSPSTLIPGTLQESIPPEVIPQKFVLRPGATAEEFQKYMKMKKEDLISDNINLKAQVASLQGVGQTGRGNGNGGHGYTPYQTGADEYDHECALLVRAKRRKLELSEDTPKSESFGVKDLISLAEFVAKRDAAPGPNLMEYIKTGVNLRADVEKNVQGQQQISFQKSEIDLKLAEMGQLERLENRRIDVALEKHQEERDDQKTLYGLIGKAIDGPVADLTKNLGAAAKTRLERGSLKPNNQNSNNPQLTQIPCPQCNKPFSIITGAQQVVCPSCNTILGLQQPPGQQPQAPIEQVPQEQAVQENQQQETEQPRAPESEEIGKLGEKPMNLETKPGEYPF